MIVLACAGGFAGRAAEETKLDRDVKDAIELFKNGLMCEASVGGQK